MQWPAADAHAAGVLAGKGLGLANVKRPAADAHDAGARAGKCETASG